MLFILNMSKYTIKIIENIIEIDELNVSLSNSDINHILFFCADWCNPCKLAGENIREISNSFKPKTKSMVVYKINIDKFDMDEVDINNDCKIKVLSEIEKLPTILYYNNGNEQPEKRIICSDKDIIMNFLSSIDELQNDLSEIADF